MRSTSLSIILLASASLAAVGCAADAPGAGTGPSDPGMGSGSDTGSGGNDVAPPASPVGKYSLQSDFDLASNMPGTVGDVVNAFIDMTDDPDDPTKWIVDHAIAALPSGTIKNLAQQAAPFVTGALNDRLLQVAPNFVTKVRDLGNKFGDVAKHFGTLETLDVAAAGAAFASTHTVTGVHFKIDAVDMDFPFADYGMDSVVAAAVPTTFDPAGKLALADHTLPLSYGKILRIALDEAIIPMVDPGAPDLAGVLADLVDCGAVGQAIADQVGFGSVSTYTSACNAGLNAGASFIYAKIAGLDASALDFNLNGTAKGLDTNHDSKIDTLQRGSWGGTLSYAGTPAPLSTASFFGMRM